MSTPLRNEDDDAFNHPPYNEFSIERPSDRYLIKILQTNKIEVIYDI